MMEERNAFVDEKCESRLYIGNLDQRITEAALIKMFLPFGKIVSEDFLLHNRGPRRGEPCGFAFIQFCTREEAKLAKEKMNGRLVYGRPLAVHHASEKYYTEVPEKPRKGGGETTTVLATSSSNQMTRTAKIAAIKSKLKAMEEENPCLKRLKQADTASRGDGKTVSSDN